MPAAVVAAVGLLVLSGAAYRLMAARLARPSNTVVFERGTLSGRLPLRIGDWIGQEREVEEAIRKAADCDDCVNRVYRRGNEAAQLWIAFGVQARDLMPHRPEVCYPGNGWTLQGTQTVVLPAEDSRDLECRMYRFSGGPMGTAMLAVLNYYIVDGEISPDVSLLRSRAWRGQGGIRYMAQIQVTCSSAVGGSVEAAERAARSFATAAADAIRECMPEPARKGAELP